MSDENLNDPSSPAEPTRSGGLTPEQRRFLGTPRTRRQRDDERTSPESSEPVSREEFASAAPVEPAAVPAPASRPGPSPAVERVRPATVSEAERESRRPAPPVATSSPAAAAAGRSSEMQSVILIIGVIILLGLAFYVGKKFDYWKYKIFTQSKPTMDAGGDKFPDKTADQLVEEGLALERQGKLSEAAERYMAAKRKDLQYRGLLFHTGKIAYDHGDAAVADKMFERSIEFGENLDLANLHRGLIAVARKNYADARRFFAAAAAADPFLPYYQFALGDVDRLDGKPQDAIAHYQEAERRARAVPEATVYRFKTRMAQLEAGQGAQLKTELAAQSKEGGLSGDWLFTKAALEAQDGKIQDAISTLSEARSMTARTVFASCAVDPVFQEAAAKNPALADALRGDSEGLQPLGS